MGGGEDKNRKRLFVDHQSVVLPGNTVHFLGQFFTSFNERNESLIVLNSF